MKETPCPRAQTAHQTKPIELKNQSKVVLEREHLAALIGAITAEWGDIDNILAAIFFCALSPQPSTSKSFTQTELASEIFGEFRSHSTMIKIVKKVIELHYGDDLVKDFVKAKTGLSDAAGGRNKIVHSRWFVSDAFDDVLFTHDKMGEPEKYSKVDFEEILEEASVVRESLTGFLFRLAGAKRK